MGNDNHRIGIDISADAGEYVSAADRSAVATDKLTSSLDRAKAQVTAASDEADKLIKRLTVQAETYGMNERQVRSYEAAQIRMNDAQRAAVNNLLQHITAQESSSSAIEGVTAAATAGAKAVAAWGAGILVATTHAVNQADEANKLSQRLGITAEEYSAYSYMARMSDVSTEEFTLSMKNLARQVRETAQGVRDGGVLFSALGIDVLDAAGKVRTLEQLLPEIADRFASFKDGPEKTALSMELFGRAGDKLIPLLNQGAAGFEALRAEAERFGLVISTETARQAEEFNDNLARLHTHMEQVGMSIASHVLPSLVKMTDQMIEGTHIAGGLASAIALFGTMNPFKTAGEQVNSLRAEIEDLEKTRARFVSFGSPTDSIDTALESARKRLEFAKLQQRQAALEGAGDVYSNEGRGFTAQVETPRIEDIKRLADLNDRLSGVNRQFQSDLRLLHAEYERGGMTIEEYRQKVAKLIETETEIGRPKKAAAGVDPNELYRDQLALNAKEADKELAALEKQREKAEKIAQTRAGIMTSLHSDYSRDNARSALAIDSESLSATERQLANDLLKVEERAQRARDAALKLHIDAKTPAESYRQTLADISAEEDRQKEIVRELAKRQEELNGSWEHGAQQGLTAYLDQVKNVAAETRQAVVSSFKGMEDALVTFAMTGKADVRSLANSIIADFLRIEAQANITGPLARGIDSAGGFSGLLSSIFGGTSGGASAGASDAVFNGLRMPAAVNHGGGVAGVEQVAVRALPADLFASAPRYHSSGIAGDEVAAILRRGEGVFTEAQMRKLSPAGDVQVTVINNGAGDGYQAKVSSGRGADGRRTMEVMFDQIESRLADRMSRGEGPLAPTVERRYGLSAAAGAMR